MDLEAGVVAGRTRSEPGPAETVLGLDNVPLDLPIAGAGSRALAAFLDYLVVAAVSILWLVGGAFAAAWARVGWGWVVAVLVVGLFVIDYGYFAGVEIATGGRSFGKWAIGLRVVARHGGRPAVAALLVRNCVRTVDLLVGVPMMSLDPLARRLGDRLAGTLVVHVRSREPEVVLHRIPRGWGGREVALLESFLRRASDLEPERAQRMARQLLGCIERDDPSLLAGVERDPDPIEALRRALQPDAR